MCQNPTLIIIINIFLKKFVRFVGKYKLKEFIYQNQNSFKRSQIDNVGPIHQNDGVRPNLQLR